MSEDLAHLVDPLRDLARRAGRAIMAHYRKGVEVRTKLDNSPVTVADEAAEEIILRGLKALTPHIPVVSEEAASGGDIPTIEGTRFWLVDPLDGTREFISHNGEFTVNIALIENGAPVLGVVHVPAHAATYTGVLAEAGPGQATLAEDGGRPYPITARKAATDGLVVAISRSHLNTATTDYLASLKVASCRKAGSSLKFCLLAAAQADLYPRFGPTMEWDTAAGHAVLRAAGGSVRTEDGIDLRYGKPGFRNPNFIARGQDS